MHVRILTVFSSCLDRLPFLVDDDVDFRGGSRRILHPQVRAHASMELGQRAGRQGVLRDIDQRCLALLIHRH